MSCKNFFIFHLNICHILGFLSTLHRLTFYTQKRVSGIRKGHTQNPSFGYTRRPNPSLICIITYFVEFNFWAKSEAINRVGTDIWPLAKFLRGLCERHVGCYCGIDDSLKKEEDNIALYWNLKNTQYNSSYKKRYNTILIVLLYKSISGRILFLTSFFCRPCAKNLTPKQHDQISVFKKKPFFACNFENCIRHKMHTLFYNIRNKISSASRNFL